MNLQQMRDLVRAQLDLDDTDLPDVLLDAYIQEGYDRVLELEQRWPFFEVRWSVYVPAEGEVEMPDDAAYIEMLIDSAGRILPRIPARLAVMSFPPGNTPTGSPAYWSRINRSIVLVPASSQAKPRARRYTRSFFCCRYARFTSVISNSPRADGCSA